MKVVKRNGASEPIDYEKIHRVIFWASQGLEGVSVSQVEINAKLSLYDGILTSDIHSMIVKSAADLISEAHPNYQYLSARLAIFHLRKCAYGQFEPPSLKAHVQRMVGLGLYDAELLSDYSTEDFEQINCMIDHNRDMNFTYAAVKQLEGKYLVQDRVKKQVFETPQFVYILCAMCLFAKEQNGRLALIREFYDLGSMSKFSLPTPIMAGVRTNVRQFSSCVLIEADDSLDSINAATSAVVKYVSQRAGIGINAGKIRALGSPIRQGMAYHTGCIPFYKMFQSAVKSCSQGGVRGGAATLFYPIWHLEVESLLVLKNNKGIDENRVRHIDYGVQLNQLFYSRLIAAADVTLFSPSDVPGLYDAFFEDQEKFKQLYTTYEADPSIRKKVIPAKELFVLLCIERSSTGRVYIQNVDHCNTHSSFNTHSAPIRQSNLCMEITLPTKPLKNILDDEGEIALCTLSAINLGAITHLDQIENLALVLVKALDNLLDYQSYPIKAAEVATKNRRPLGIGVTNFAYYLAKNAAHYDDQKGRELTHQLFEAIQFYLLKASNRLAIEKGPCPLFSETKYAKGLLPIDHYKKEVDQLADVPLRCDWEWLRKSIMTHGLRNSTLTAVMPCETSSQISNSTNGIEPPRAYVSVKSSKDGVLKQVVPEYESLKDKYDLLWNLKSNEGYLTLVAIMQKFVDQSISANTSYNPDYFPDQKVPLKQMVRDLLFAYRFGLKTLYYHNTRDGAGE